MNVQDKVKMIVGYRAQHGNPAGDCHEIFPRRFKKISWPSEDDVDVHCVYIHTSDLETGKTVKVGYSVRSVDESFEGGFVSMIGRSRTDEGYRVLAEAIAAELPGKDKILVHVH